MKTVFQARSAAVAAAVILIAGCSSMQSHMAQTQMSGIMCDKCQTVWFPKIPVPLQYGRRPGTALAREGSRFV